MNVQMVKDDMDKECLREHTSKECEPKFLHSVVWTATSMCSVAVHRCQHSSCARSQNVWEWDCVKTCEVCGYDWFKANNIMSFSFSLHIAKRTTTAWSLRRGTRMTRPRWQVQHQGLDQPKDPVAKRRGIFGSGCSGVNSIISYSTVKKTNLE